jgi:predicted MPP superfamily phosphohydrolase
MNPIFLERLQVDRLNIKIRNLPESLAGTKLVQMSDFHYDGYCLTPEFLEEAISISNGENPDLVLLTGDYVTDDPTPIHDLASRIKYLRSRHGVYACLGNHDNYYSQGRADITKALTKVNVQVLWNEIAKPFGEQFPLVGLADFWSGEFSPKKILEQIDPHTPRLVLSHNPDTAALLKNWRVDLQLSGHTHGGQITIPGYRPVPILIQELGQSIPKPLRGWIPFLKECSQVVKHWEWSQGHHEVDSNQLYVNRGLGTYFPGRLFCPPELTVITLERYS